MSPSPGDLLNPGIKPRSPALQVDSLLAEPPGKDILGIGHSGCPASVSPSSVNCAILYLGCASPLNMSYKNASWNVLCSPNHGGGNLMNLGQLNTPLLKFAP